MIYISTKGLIDDVPVDKMKDFEREFVERLNLNHADVVKTLRETGKPSDEINATFEKVAKDLVSIYVN